MMKNQDFTMESIHVPRLDIDKLLFLGGVLFGSRALNILNSPRDYDIALLKPQVDELLKQTDYNFEVYSVEDYFNIIPRNKGNYLVRGIYLDNGKKIDILAIADESDLNIIKKSVEDISHLDPMFLSVKQNRVTAYQKALLKNGFKYKNIQAYLAMKLPSIFSKRKPKNHTRQPF